MTLLHDLRYALRILRKNPGFASVAILTLALGIGANTAIFSIINGVLLSPLHYPGADRIVSLGTYFKQTGKTVPRLTGGDLLDIRDGTQLFEGFSVYIGGEMGVQLRDRAEFTGTYFVNPDFFRVLGLQAAYGRTFEQRDGETVSVVSEPFAQRNFGSAANALGQDVRVENQTYRVVGVLPAGFPFPARTNVWVPTPLKPENLNRTAYNYHAIAKLRAGVTLDAAKAQLDTVGVRLATQFPDSNRNKSFVAVPLRDEIVGPVRTTLYFLMGAVALVLLIACTNVADLMLARATARAREIAVRAAIGAGRWQIIRPLLLESAALAVLGGAVGFALAEIGTRVLATMSASSVPLPRLAEIHVDWLVLGFASAVSLLASLLFGLTPAWQATRVDLHDALKQGGSRGQIGGRSPGLRNGLVVAQIALSFVLAVGAGLLLRSFAALTSVQLGYRTEGMLVMYAHAPAQKLNELLDVGRFFENVFGEIQRLPGVTSVAGAMGLPNGQYGSNGSYAVAGKHVFAPGQRLPHADFSLASPGYFATMGIPLSRGRDFSTRDDYDAPLVVIVSESVAHEVFPNEDPIGRRIQCGFDSVGKWMTIVGVVGDVRQDSPASAPGPTLYMPLKQHPYRANELQVIARTTLPPATLITPVRDKVHALNPEVATKFTTMDAMVSDSVARPRFRMFLISGFAGLALALAMIGVYGVMSYVLAQRTSEFGLRMALGASTGNVATLVFGKTMKLAAIGLGTGLLLALAASRVMTTMLFGLKATDAITYTIVLLAVTPVIVLASAIPAWRATRIDPLAALREE